jgi:P4 family phage/plasmid primase-like protien
MATDAPFLNMVSLPNAGKDAFDELLYAKKFLKKVGEIRVRQGDWFVYQKGAFRPTMEEHFHQTALAILPEKLRSWKNAQSVLNQATGSTQLQIDDQLFGAMKFAPDGKTVLINVDNGILQVGEEVKLLKHDATQHFTGRLTASWTGDWKKDTTPIFNEVLAQVLPDEGDRVLLQWFAGYLLYPSCKHEIFLVSYGPGGTGKSTISDAIMEVLGPTQRTVLSMAQICAEGQGAYSLPTLQHAAVNMGTEMDTVLIGDSANFKRLVSGEPIEVRPIYGKPYSQTSKVKLWFNSNGLPRFKHGTDAELRRSRFLYFNKPVAKKDVTLKERMTAERDGLLSWMVEALQQIIGGCPAPEGGVESMKVKAAFGTSNDPVAAFLHECCVLGENQQVLKDRLFDAFSEWMSGQGFSAKAKDSLCQKILQDNPTIGRKRRRDDYRDPDGIVFPKGHYLTGIDLLEDQ